MFVCLDLETTGFDPKRNRIIEIAAVKFDENGKIHNTFSSLVNPGVTLSPLITALTGITDEALKNAPHIQKIQKHVIDFCGGDSLVGHNIMFDYGFLEQNGISLTGKTYDTIELARILFMKELSYSLDILAKNFSLTHKPQHRALDDVLATIDLFLFLLAYITRLPEKTIKMLIPLFQKTDWPLKDLFRINTSVKQKRAYAPQEKASRPLIIPIPSFDTALLLQNAIIETQEYFALAQLPKNKKIFVVYGTKKRGDKRKNETEQLENAACIYDSKFYIAPKRLKAFLAKPALTNEEASFATKILIWLEKTSTGVRHEISLNGVEYRLWDEICDMEGTDEFFTKSLLEAQQKNIIIGHHAFLLSQTFKTLDVQHLIIEEALELEDNFTNALSVRITQEHFDRLPISEALRGRIGVLFGLIGMYFEKYTEPAYKSDVVIDAMFLQTEEGRRIMRSLKTILEDQTVAENTDLRSMHEIFRNSNDNMISYISGYTGNIHVVSAPLTVAIPTHAETTALIDSALFLNGNCDFIKEIYKLDSLYTAHETGYQLQNLTITIPSDIPEPNTTGYFKKYIELVKQTINAYGGNILIVLHTKKAIEATYAELLQYSQDRSIKLLAQGVVGGKGKIIDLFATEPKTSVALVLQNMLDMLDPIEEGLKCVIFQKIPFAFSTNPIFAARPKQYTNGFEQYTLPRALLRFKKFLASLNETNKPRTLIILDRRLLEKSYGNMFLNEIYGTGKNLDKPVQSFL